MASTAVTLHPTRLEAASGAGAVVDLVQQTSLDLTLKIDSVVGTLAVRIDNSEDGSVWTKLYEFVPTSSVGTTIRTLAGCLRYVRATWTLTGPAAAATFSLAGKAFLVYVTPADVKALSVAREALDELNDAEIDKVARTETATANSYLGAYTLPLLAWGDDIRSKTSDIVAHRLLSRRGFDPECGSDNLIVDARNAAISWFELVAAGRLIPDGVIDSSTPDPDDDPQDTDGSGFYAESDPPRGW